jgi:hypothetical protein
MAITNHLATVFWLPSGMASCFTSSFISCFINGGCSSVGRVPDCDSGCRGFEPHQSPQLLLRLASPLGGIRLTSNLNLHNLRHRQRRDVVQLFIALCVIEMSQFSDAGIECANEHLTSLGILAANAKLHALPLFRG